MNEFPNGQPFLGFKNKKEETKFFDVCDYAIKRKREIFGRKKKYRKKKYILIKV